MARATPIISSFTGGEVSELIYGRPDQNRYYTSSRRCENFICLPQGPAERRGGTRFIERAKFQDQKVRLIPFEFSDVQAYAIEAGDHYFRFYMEKGRIAAAGPAWAASATYAKDACVSHAGFVWRSLQSGNNSRPPDVSPAWWVVATICEIESPYGADDLPGLKWCQSGDVMYIVHPKYAPRRLSRTGHAAWALDIVDFVDGPYLEENPTSTTLSLSAMSGAVTIYASSAIGINGGAGFVAGDVGRLIRLKPSTTTWGYVKITAVNSALSVNAVVHQNFGAANSTAAWRLGLWSDNTGWPSAVTIHEERLTFASATKLRPQRIDASKTGDFECFSPGTGDADPISFSVGSNKVNKISWISSMRALLLGTQGGEFAVISSGSGAALTPTGIDVKLHTRSGCANIAPVEVGQAVLFVQRQGRKVREMRYAYESDGYTAPSLTWWADHVTRTGVLELAYQQEPYSLIWAIRSDGQLIAMTYLPEEQVSGWHRHPLADNGAVESIAVIPGDGADQLWIVVRRVVNGATVRYIEILEDPLPLDGSQADAYYVDSGLSYAGPPVSRLTGLDHLEGKAVQILAGGGVHPERTVSGGAVDLAWPAIKVHVGLGYVSTLMPMRVEAGAGEGTAQGKIKLITKVIIRFARSLGGVVGRDESHLEPILSDRDPSVPMDQPMPLFSGDATVDFPGTYEDTGDLIVSQNQPLPMTINAIIPRVVTADG